MLRVYRNQCVIILENNVLLHIIQINLKVKDNFLVKSMVDEINIINSFCKKKKKIIMIIKKEISL